MTWRRVNDDSICPRVITKEQLIAGLKAGRTAVVDRKDAPELDDLMELLDEGLVTVEYVEYDEQSTAMKWRWKEQANGPV